MGYNDSGMNDGSGGYGDTGGNWSDFGGGVGGYGAGHDAFNASWGGYAAPDPTLGYSMHAQQMAGITGPQAAAMGRAGTFGLADAMGYGGVGGGYSMHDQRMAQLTGLQAAALGALGTQQAANYAGGRASLGDVMGGMFAKPALTRGLLTAAFTTPAMGLMSMLASSLKSAHNPFSKPSTPGASPSSGVSGMTAGGSREGGGNSESALLDNLAAAMTTGRPQQAQAPQPRANGLLDLYRQMYG
jgi:hypothetical protein